MKKILLAFFLLSASISFADDIILPEPEKTGGIGILDAISARHSARDFIDTEITYQQLSTILWVAGGINRSDGKITHATAMNLQDMILYAFTSQGVYRYNPEGHTLTPIAEGDYRELTGGQDFVKRAAVDLLYVQDAEKWERLGRQVPKGEILNCGFSHAGLSMQGVYLYAASIGWGARTRMSFDHAELKKILGLTDKHNITLMQCVGPEVKN